MKRFWIFALVLSVFLSGCQNLSQELTEEEKLLGTDSFLTREETLPPDTEPLPEISQTETKEREEEVLSSDHTHNWKTVSVRDATCTAAGKEEQTCTCGQTRVVETGILNHAFTGATCLEPSVCLSCGKTGSHALGHTPQNGRCTRCQSAMTNQIFVLGKELCFDASPAEIFSRLGTPTETLTEGEYVSFLYAADLNRFTVIQTDSKGLWGVFTMDPSAKFFLGNETVTIADFRGEPDPNSDAVFRDLATCRVFGFRDLVQGGENYAMWLRYEERVYDYMNDPAIFSNYDCQSRLSFHYVNALRARHSLSSLLWSNVCAQVAVEYSSYMIESGFFGHDHSYLTRLKEKGVSYQNAGENLSRGYYNAFFVTDAYYNSESHRRNILDPVFRYVGVGFVKRAGEALSVFGAQIYYS